MPGPRSRSPSFEIMNADHCARSWLTQQATSHASSDLLRAAAVTVVLTAIPVLWLRDRRVSCSLCAAEV
jgi:hypothetical protein